MSLVLVAGLAVLALSALGVSSASAAKACKKLPSSLKERGLWNTDACSTSVAKGEWALAWATNKGTETEYCVLGGTTFTEDLCFTGGSGPFEKKKVAERYPGPQGKLTLSTLTGHAATIATTIDCKGGTFSGESATQTLNENTHITYTECVPTAPANCEVGTFPGNGKLGTLATNTLNGEQASTTSRLVNFTPVSESRFIEIEYTGSSCSLKNKKFPITGSQMCQFASGSETTLAEEQTLECKKSESALKLGTEKAEYEGNAKILFEHLFWKA